MKNRHFQAAAIFDIVIEIFGILHRIGNLKMYLC